MSRRRLERLLWILAAVLLVAAWARWRRPFPVATAAAPADAPAPAAPPRVPAATLAQAADAVRQHDVFRLDRVPAPVGFAAGQAALLPPPPMPPPRPPQPPLAVTGIVGPPWAAVLEGVPGRQGGTLVKTGDRLGDLRIRSVTRDQVVVQGADTTWRLTVRRPWQ